MCSIGKMHLQRGGEPPGTKELHMLSPEQRLSADWAQPVIEAISSASLVLEAPLVRGLIDYSNPHSLGATLRRRRFRVLNELIGRVIAAENRCRILDIGGTAHYWKDLSVEISDKISIVILNLHHPRGADPKGHPPESLDVSHVVGDGRDLSGMSDASFDLCHSNSVLEHVGGFADMVRFADETRRVGKWYFVQTPSLWFPIEPHYGAPFIHWFPWPIRARLLTSMAIGFKDKFPSYRSAIDYVEFVNLIDAFTLRNLFPDANIVTERFLMLPKSNMAIRSP